MANSDTTIIEAEAPRFDGHQFDVVQLASMGGALGAKVWSYSHRLDDVGKDPKRPLRATTRLIVCVEDDPKAEASVQRVRAALKWEGDYSPCPF